MDLTRLAWFFIDDVQVCEQAFFSSVQHPNAPNWLEACRVNLLESLFGVTHKLLMSQYKLVDRSLSYEDFCESLKEPEVRTYIFERYPALRSRMDNVVTGWINQACAVANRFENDRAYIQSLLDIDVPLEISRVEFGLGDRHRGGKNVASLAFKCNRKVIYKPRDLSIDTHFTAIVDWFNERADSDLQLPRHLNMGTHGWVEFINYTECSDDAATKRYYHRMGQWLGLLYVLEGTDFHYENIIAAGEHPVLIDLETFFHPHTPIDGTESNEAIDLSVLRICVVPNRWMVAGGKPEITGLADVAGQLGFSSLVLTIGEDGVAKLERRRGELLGANNVPSLGGQKVVPGAEHVEELKSGFARVYEAILDARSDFSDLIAACAGDEIRTVLRNTAAYARLLEEAGHPKTMTSLSAVERHFNLLHNLTSDFAVAARFIEFEIADLHKGDIPLFTTHVNSRDLYYADDAFIKDFFDLSGLDVVQKKLGMLSKSDLQRQLWIIGNAFEAHSGRLSKATRDSVRLQPATVGETLEEKALAQAEMICTQLRSQMYIDDNTASWLVPVATSLDNSQHAIIPAFYDLYCGAPGEILLFAQMAMVQGDASHIEVSQKALEYLKRRLNESKVAIRPLGMYAGWGGILHMLCALAQLQSNFEHLDYAEELIADPIFDELVEVDRNFGLIKGTAGFMLACADLYMISRSPRALQLAKACATHLKAHRSADHVGYSWQISSSVPLSGLSHGASGFAMAFARLYQATGDEQYREASLQALAYERTLFIEADGNWRDCRDIVVRKYGDAPISSVAWAHGAPGIGLARLALLRAGIDTPEIREDLNIALKTTLADGVTDKDSLIFGAFGNLEFLICYVECFGQAAVPGFAKLVSALLDRVERQNLNLSTAEAFPLGFMTGATGIAYQCLRLARMHEVPSLLCGTSRVPSAASVPNSQCAVEMVHE